VRAEATARELEEALARRDLTLGALGPRLGDRTVGALLAAPHPSEATPRGRFVDRCASLDAVLPDGTAITTRLAPRRATGPDLAHALLDARGTTGRITAAHLRVERAPQHVVHLGFAWPASSGASAIRRARELLACGVEPAHLFAYRLPRADALGDGRLGSLASTTAPGGSDATRVVLGMRLDGPRELVEAEERLAVALCTDGAEGVRAMPPSEIAEETASAWPSSLHQRFVPWAALDAEWSRPVAGLLIASLRSAGAALLAPSHGGDVTHDAERPSPVAAALRAALAERLGSPRSPSENK
jgi:FAD/FMN-containing dehydrogenase